MKRVLFAVLLSVIVLGPAFILSDDSSGEEASGVLFYEVQPYGSNEGVSLFNYGSGSVNLKGWSIYDGEGTLKFIADVILPSKTRLTVASTITAGNWFTDRDNVISFSDSSIEKTNTLALADGGDDIYLYRDGTLMDTVCYGSKTTDTGWSGESAKLSSSRYLLRSGTYDTDTSSDWISTKYGFTNNVFDPELFFDASVTPFSFPESRGVPVFEALEKAEDEVLISMYFLTSPQLTALLCKLSEEGVTVRIILEGSALGMDLTTELKLMKSLVDAGGEVYLINDSVSGNYERYSYFHNKYAVIDRETVVVTSENWTVDNLGAKGNRGWGAVIESNGYAEYVRDIFLNDVDPKYGDIKTLYEYNHGVTAYTGDLTYAGITYPYQTTAYGARVMPAFSPDTSWSTLRYFVENAETRVYSQQMDLGSSYETITNASSPLNWLSAAADRGVDTRFILDSTTDRSAAEKAVKEINEKTGIKAINIRGTEMFSLIHNKGVVIDDYVWVASVNWTENSFLNNREVAVLIDSPEVTDFFVRLYIKDWGVNMHTVEEDGLTITMEGPTAAGGEIVYTFSVSGPEFAFYSWDILGNGEIRTSSVNKIVCKDLPAGTHTITVTMDGTEYTESIEYYVESNGSSGAELPIEGSYLAGIIAAIIALLGGAGYAVKRRNNDPRT